MKCCCTLVIILLIIGGLNWGLVGFFDFDLVAMIFGKGSILSRVIYSLVGIAALAKIFFWNHSCSCSTK